MQEVKFATQVCQVASKRGALGGTRGLIAKATALFVIGLSLVGAVGGPAEAHQVYGAARPDHSPLSYDLRGPFCNDSRNTIFVPAPGRMYGYNLTNGVDAQVVSHRIILQRYNGSSGRWEVSSRGPWFWNMTDEDYGLADRNWYQYDGSGGVEGTISTVGAGRWRAFTQFHWSAADTYHTEHSGRHYNNETMASMSYCTIH